MELHLRPGAPRVERPAYVWIGLVAALATGLAAIPVGLLFMTDPSGASMGLPSAWVDHTVFGSYLVPGLYLLVMNGLGMLALAGLIVRRHWTAPWLMGVLGVGLMAWIAVQLLVMPETMVLQWIFLAIGAFMALAALFWLRRTGQLRLW